MIFYNPGQGYGKNVGGLALEKMINAAPILGVQIPLHGERPRKTTGRGPLLRLAWFLAKGKPAERALTIGGTISGFKITPGIELIRRGGTNGFRTASCSDFFPHMIVGGKAVRICGGWFFIRDGKTRSAAANVPKYGGFLPAAGLHATRALGSSAGFRRIGNARGGVWTIGQHQANPESTATVRFGREPELRKGDDDSGFTMWLIAGDHGPSDEEFFHFRSSRLPRPNTPN